MRHPYPRNHPRIAKYDGRAVEVIKQPNSAPQQHRRDINMDLVEQPRIEALLDGIRAVRTSSTPSFASATKPSSDMDMRAMTFDFDMMTLLVDYNTQAA